MMTVYEYLLLFLWFFIMILLSNLIDRMFVRILPGIGYRIFIAPGIIIHEVSHAIGCILTGAKVLEIKVFQREGGYVKHTPPRVPLIGKPIISLAPIFGGVIILYLLTVVFGMRNVDGAIWAGSSSTITGFVKLFEAAFDFIGARWTSVFFWIFIYFLIAITTTMAPSHTDMKHAVFGLGVLLVIGSALIAGFDAIARAMDPVGDTFAMIFGIGIIFEILAVIILTPIYFIKRVVT